MKNHTLFYANGLIVIAFIATIAHLLYSAPPTATVLKK